MDLEAIKALIGQAYEYRRTKHIEGIMSLFHPGARFDHSRVRLRFIPKNFAVTTDLVDMWKFDEGKIVELVEFVDTALINDLVR
jgi:hypothetical protein